MLRRLIDKLVSRDTLEIRVAMVGPRRAGKTSMLSAMYERFENALISEGVSDQVALSADADTMQILSANYKELIRVIKSGKNIAEAITGDSEARSYSFDLKRSRNTTDIQIHLSFQDYPGGWLMAGARDPSNKDYQRVLSFIKNAHVLLVAVDAPYLMEEEGKWHEQRNMPNLVARTVKESWATSDETPRMVIFVPIKCEKYDTTNLGRKNLVGRVREGYTELITHLATMPCCAVLCAPAQTTGCVTFDHFLYDEDGALPTPVFSMPEDRGYRPRDCSQTLRYCLVYALKRYVKDAGMGVVGHIREFFKLDRNFVDAAKILAAGCRGTFFQTMNRKEVTS